MSRNQFANTIVRAGNSRIVENRKSCGVCKTGLLYTQLLIIYCFTWWIFFVVRGSKKYPPNFFKRIGIKKASYHEMVKPNFNTLTLNLNTLLQNLKFNPPV
jgi:hypothetical protein